MTVSKRFQTVGTQCFDHQHPPVPNGTHPPICLIENNEGRKAMSARALHKSLHLSERFSKWTERMFEYGFVEGLDYTPHMTEHPQNGQQYADYILTLACGKEIAMLQRTDTGKKIRLYLLECERQIEQLATKPDNQYTGLIKLVNEQTQRIIGLECRINLMHKARTTYFKSVVADRQKEREVKKQNQYKEGRNEFRAKFFKVFEEYIHHDRFANPENIMNDVFKKLSELYSVKIEDHPRGRGEHRIDVAFRIGVGQELMEVIKHQMPKCGLFR